MQKSNGLNTGLYGTSLVKGFHIELVLLITCHLFDFSKTFDSVPHTRLLLKLEVYGIHGKALIWLTIVS